MGIKSKKWKQMTIGAGKPYVTRIDETRLVIRQAGKFVKAMEFPTPDELVAWCDDNRDEYIIL